MATDNGGMPVGTTCRLSPRQLGSDFPRPLTGTGLPPPPARLDFPSADTVFVCAFIPAGNKPSES